MTSNDGRVTFERYRSVGVVTLDRPLKRNALNFRMRQGLRDAFDEAADDVNTRCVVLKAEGSTFCAGADLHEMVDNRTGRVHEDHTQLLGSDSTFSKPTIAVVTGPAVAGGFLLSQSCDLMVVGHSASFSIAEAKWGRGTPWATRFYDLLPPRVLKELLLTGDPINSQRAYDLGLANRLVDDSDAFDLAVGLAETIAKNAPLSIAASLKMLDLTANVGPMNAREPAEWLFQEVYDSLDALEGPRAFKEGRAPNWSGR